MTRRRRELRELGAVRAQPELLRRVGREVLLAHVLAAHARARGLPLAEARRARRAGRRAHAPLELKLERIVGRAVAATLGCDPSHIGETSCVDTDVRRRRLTDVAALISFSLAGSDDSASTATELAESVATQLSEASSSGAQGRV